MNTNAILASALLFGMSLATTGVAQSFTPVESKATGQVESDSRKQASDLLRRARTAMKGGNLELAERFILQAEKLDVSKDGIISRFADSPAKARRDLDKLKQGQTGGNRLKELFTKSTGKPLPLPAVEPKTGEPQALGTIQDANAIAANGPYPTTEDTPSPQAEAQARSIMAQAKAAFDRGDLTLASNLTKQAYTMGVPEKAFAGGDTPWELGMKIDRQLTLTGGVAATAGTNPGATNVQTAIYEAGNDGSYVRTASGEQELPPTNALAQQVSDFGGLNGQPEPVTALPAGDVYAPVSTPYEINSPQPSDPYALPTDASPEPTPAFASPDAMNEPISVIPTQTYESSAEVRELMQQGEESIRNGNLAQARDYFREAWGMQDQLDAGTRQRLQEHLQLLRVDSNEQNAAEEITAADREEAARIRRFVSDVQREQQAIARELRVSPKAAWERMKELRQAVDDADLPDEVRRPLANRLDQAVNETERFIDANRAQIELDERNREVLAMVDRERKLRVETENQLAAMVNEFNEMMDQQRYSEAYVLARQARELQPRSEVTESMIWKSRFAERMYVELSLRERRDRQVEFGLDPTDIDTPDAINYPIAFPKKWDELVRRRQGLLSDGRSRYNEAEQEIERALRKRVQVQFDETPLSEVIDTLGRMTGVNVFLDIEGLAAEGVTTDTPITMNLSQEISLKSVLNLILSQHRLGYVIQDEVLRITSETARAGDVYPETYYVGDLVIPIPNFMPGYNNGMAGALAQAHAALGYGPGGWASNRNQQQAPLVIAENSGDQNVASPLALGQLTSASPMPNMPNAPQPGVGGMGGASGADFDTLINLITSTVAPDTWDDVGGPGAIESFDGNLSLVIINTQEVHEQVVDLLEQLRRLQDLQVTIEVRFITLQDNFFERIGVDFDFDIRDKTGFTQDDLVNPDSGVDVEDTNITIGLDPNGNPTLDLDLSFSQNSFASAIPPFGGFDPTAASTFGFAILSDIEAFFVVEAIQGDSRTNVMQAPKITMFNGQFASINDTSSRPFVTSVVPVVGDFAVAQQPIILVLAEGTQLSVQAVVSNDRRFVRLTMLPMFSQIGDVDTFTFEGRTSSDTGTSTETDPDDNTTATNTNNTQFTEGTTVQLPNFATTSVSTTVSVPDGGTVLMGGIKRLAEGRTERGMPILSKLPYVSRLFKNVGIGRETQTLMMMVTPRIIIQEEEEEKILGTATP